MKALLDILNSSGLSNSLLEARHNSAKRLIYACVAFVPVIGLIGYFAGQLGVLPLVMALVFAAIAFSTLKHVDRFAETVIPLAVMGQCIAFTAAFSGTQWQMDAHMMFFAAMASLASLVSLKSLVVGTLVVALHHLALGAFMPALVFPSVGLLENMERAVFHAVILVMEVAALGASITIRIQLDRKNTQSMEHAAQAQLQTTAIRQEQENSIEQLKSALGHLSNGDLTIRLPDDMPPSFQGLRDDFNQAVENLRAVLDRVRIGATDVQRQIRDIDTASEDLSMRTQSQAATLEETAAALSELNSSVQSSASVAQRSSEATKSVQSRASKSQDIVEQAVGAMESITASAQKIASMNALIEDIAFQTNLLALNAGVEAARAGEAGRGFAVVASEVRGLSQRASDAANDIRDLIEESGAEVATGVELVGKTGETLQEIIGAVSEMNTFVGEISTAAIEQAKTVHEINGSMTHLDRITQQNAAMFEETTTASKQLDHSMTTMHGDVSAFYLGDDDTQTEVHPIAQAG